MFYATVTRSCMHCQPCAHINIMMVICCLSMLLFRIWNCLLQVMNYDSFNMLNLIICCVHNITLHVLIGLPAPPAYATFMLTLNEPIDWPRRWFSLWTWALWTCSPHVRRQSIWKNSIRFFSELVKTNCGLNLFLIPTVHFPQSLEVLSLGMRVYPSQLSE